MTSADLMRYLAWLRRYPFCVTCGCVALAMAVTSWFLWQQVQTLKEELATKTTQSESMQATLLSSKTLKEDFAYVQEYTRRIEENLVGENLAANKGYFYQFEEQTKAQALSGTDVDQFPAPLPDSESLYKRVPFSLKLTGTYEQLASFLRAVETGPRVANITSFSFNRGTPPSPLLTLDLNVELLGKL